MKQQSGALGILVERDVAVGMRDGVTLRANVFRLDSARWAKPAVDHSSPRA